MNGSRIERVAFLPSVIENLVERRKVHRQHSKYVLGETLMLRVGESTFAKRIHLQDACKQGECCYVKKTVEEDLPQEADYLRRYDAFKESVTALIDMPDRTIDLLFRMLRQNNGRLSKRAREKEFAMLTADETQRIEQVYTDTFAAGHRIRASHKRHAHHHDRMKRNVVLFEDRWDVLSEPIEKLHDKAAWRLMD